MNYTILIKLPMSSSRGDWATTRQHIEAVAESPEAIREAFDDEAFFDGVIDLLDMHHHRDEVRIVRITESDFGPNDSVTDQRIRRDRNAAILGRCRVHIDRIPEFGAKAAV